MTIANFFSYSADIAEYLANVSAGRRYFYLNNPKVASSTILFVLQTAERRGVSPSFEELHDRSKSPLRPLSKLPCPLETVLTSGMYFRFTYVRNPFTRALSCYLDKMVQNNGERKRLAPELGFAEDYHPTFREFLEAVQRQPDERRDIHWMTQSLLLQLNTIQYDFIGRFESFSSSFPRVLERINVPPEYFSSADKRSRHPTNSASKLQEYIGEPAKKLILTIYESDFKALAYGSDLAAAPF